MNSPLLATKLSIPSTGRYLVDRSLLFFKLNDCLSPGCRLGLLSAPAGFGKTTLLSSWISAIKSSNKQPFPSAAWVSLDDKDNDPNLFWAYFITSIHRQLREIGEQSLSRLRASIHPDLESNLSLLINELAGNPNPFILILDDYHFIRNPAVHKTLTFFLERTPSHFHVILASRTDPPLPLALLRGRGQLVDIRLNDLRFSTADAESFLNVGMGLNLSTKAVEALNQKTEGWIAGLQMAALSLKEAASSNNLEKIENLIDTFSGTNRYILDYLIEEVLDQQPAQIQNFMFGTSILNRLCSPLCNTLFEVVEGNFPADSQEVLDYLDSSHLFLIALDDKRIWFRYHRLFADLLRIRLNQKFDQRFVAQLHKSASKWYQQNGYINEAVDHALSSKDFEQAARLAEQNAMAMFIAGEWITLLGWMKRLPEILIQGRPWLCIYYAWALVFTGQLEPIETLLCTVEELIQKSVVIDDKQDILGNIAIIRARVAARRGDLLSAFKLAETASAILPVENLMARSASEFIKGEAYFEKGALVNALESFSQARSMGEAADNLYVVIPAITETAKILKIQGKLRNAAGSYQTALELLSGQEEKHPRLFGPVFVGYGDLLREWNDLPSAQNFTDRGIETCLKYGITNSAASGYDSLAWILNARGESFEAGEAGQKSILLIRNAYSRMARMVTASQICFCLVQGNLHKALDLLEKNGIQPVTPGCFSNEIECIAHARVLLAQEKQEEALNLLDNLLVYAQSNGCSGWLIQIENLRALALFALGKPSAALQALETCLAIAEPENYFRAFLDEGPQMANLLAAAVERTAHKEYASRLLAAFPDRSQSGLSPLDLQIQNQSLIEPLSAREIDVLELISDGLTNKEIAQKLCVSLRTVKYYATNIYSKLGAAGRTQAVYSARKLGLL